MKLQSFFNSLSILLATAFPIASISSQAESRCPGDVTGLRPRMVVGALLVVRVKVNNTGPFDFMVDTGTQLNVIDPSLAAQLDLKSQGAVGLVSTASYSQASVAVLDSLQAGPYTVANPLVVVQDLGAIRAADVHILGVLGENFLSHFDVLIDYAHHVLCLDQAKLIDQKLRGERIPLMPPKHPEDEWKFSPRLVVSVNLSSTGTRPILLQLDSGSDGPILYADNPGLEQPLLKRAKLQESEASEALRTFAALPPQEMRIGTRVMRKVPFVTPVSSARNIPDRDEDGVLATVLFERVFISHTDRYLIIDPK